MKIMILSDTESIALWDFFDKKKLEGVDLILSCGDLNPQYLSFLATFFNGPILYVHGNHDERYKSQPPEGCICIEDKIYKYKGLRILGLGGSMRYKDGAHQYTEKEMQHRVKKLFFSLWKNKGFDILLTHSPAYHLNDGEDLPHHGFQIFLDLMDKYSPRYFIHGHVHMNYSRDIQRICTYKNTTVINGYEKYLLELS